MARNRTSFSKGNKAAEGADHSQRKFLTQRLISALNEYVSRSWAKDKRFKDYADLKSRRKFELLIDQLIERGARYGDMDAIKFIFERTEGKMPVPIGDNEEEKTLTVIVKGGLPKKK